MLRCIPKRPKGYIGLNYTTARGCDAYLLPFIPGCNRKRFGESSVVPGYATIRGFDDAAFNGLMRSHLTVQIDRELGNVSVHAIRALSGSYLSFYARFNRLVGLLH